MIDSGTPRPSTSSIRLLPFFPPIRGVWPDRFLCQRGFHQRPVDALPAPGDALHIVVLGQPRLPQSTEQSRSLPFQKAFVDRTGTAESLLGQGLPLAACAQHVHDRLEHRARFLGLAPTARLTLELLFAQACRPLWHERLHPLPERIRYFPRGQFGLRQWPSPLCACVRRRENSVTYYLRISSMSSRSAAGIV